MIAKRRPQTLRKGAMTAQQSRTTAQARYWRTFLRKSGEALDLGGKALTAAGAAGVLAPLATKAVLRIPTAAILATILVGIAFVVFGVHLQALADRSSPDE
jgi:hypothetical protein